MIRVGNRLPVIILGFLLLLLLLSLQITGKSPDISSIEPKIAQPGEVLVIRGSHFGSARGRVSISGIVPVSSAYLEWSPQRISVRIPEEARSGLVHVITGKGRSDGVIFTNKNDIPVIVRGGERTDTPFIEALEPERSSVGGRIIITGRNFGHNRDNGLVLFAWAPGADGTSPGPSESKNPHIPALALDFDYEAWSDREIRVRVPVGAGSGGIMVQNDKGRSNSVYFELDQSAGRRIFRDKRTYTIQSSIDVRNTSERAGGGLYLWIPRVQESPVQRDVSLLNQDPKADIEDYNGLMLVYLPEPVRGETYRISQTYILDRYALETKILPDRIKNEYDTERPLYRVYTASNAFTPAEAPEIVRTVQANGGRERNPYTRARRLYNFVLARMGHDPGKSYQDALKGLEERKGDSYTYATLYVAMLRAAGVPARTISGYIVTDDKTAVPHFWTEFYLENFGWVPADPTLGDRAAIKDYPYPADPAGYFFGGISNRHLAFSHGLVQAKKVSPHGRTLEQPDIHSLQTMYAEAVGNLTSFAGTWNNLQVVGIY